MRDAPRASQLSTLGDIDHHWFGAQLFLVPEGVWLGGHAGDQAFRVGDVAEISGMSQACGGAAGQFPLFYPMNSEMAFPGVADR